MQTDDVAVCVSVEHIYVSSFACVEAITEKMENIVGRTSRMKAYGGVRAVVLWPA